MTRVRFAGIDPGSSTGITIIELPRVGAQAVEVARWLDSFSLSALGETKTRTKAEGLATLFELVRNVLVQHDVETVVLECPIDAMPVWGRATGRTKGAGRGTIFGSGAHYGICLAAARAAMSVRHIHAYRVSTTKKHEGWMPLVRGGARGNLVHVQRREITLQQLRDVVNKLSRSSFASRDNRCGVGIGDDELMAFGVLAYHLRRTPRPPAR